MSRASLSRGLFLSTLIATGGGLLLSTVLYTTAVVALGVSQDTSAYLALAVALSFITIAHIVRARQLTAWYLDLSPVIPPLRRVLETSYSSWGDETSEDILDLITDACLEGEVRAARGERPQAPRASAWFLELAQKRARSEPNRDRMALALTRLLRYSQHRA